MYTQIFNTKDYGCSLIEFKKSKDINIKIIGNGEIEISKVKLYSFCILNGSIVSKQYLFVHLDPNIFKDIPFYIGDQFNIIITAINEYGHSATAKITNIKKEKEYIDYCRYTAESFINFMADNIEK